MLMHTLKKYKQSTRDFIRNIKTRQKISFYLKAHSVKKLQIGSSINLLPGWLNSDLFPSSEEQTFLDARKTFPFEDKTFDCVFSEHQLEHLTYEEGSFMLKECYRILKTEGKIRIATPDLEVILALYKNKNKSKIQEQYIEAYRKHFLQSFNRNNKEVFVINNMFYNFCHKFIYDKETLVSSLKSAGFTGINQYTPGESKDENLRGIEQHNKVFKAIDMENAEEINSFETMVFEATRPI